MTWIDRLRSMGTASIDERRQVEVAVREDRRVQEAEDRRRRVDLADAALAALIGSERPDKSGWRPYAGDWLLIPIGEPDEWWASGGHDPSDGPDGEIIWKPDRGGELWYRPRLQNGSGRIEDAEHLGRMIVASSIYA